MIWKSFMVAAIVFSSCGVAKTDTNFNEPVLDSVGEEEEYYEIDDSENIEDLNPETVAEKNFLKWDRSLSDSILDSTLVSSWTFSQLFQVVMSEWPEAYEDFVDISFEKLEDRVTPEKISFLIPTRKLDEIDAAEVQNRFDRVTLKMFDNLLGCQHYKIGESKTYSWSKWEDKEVTKITFHFMFSC